MNLEYFKRSWDKAIDNLDNVKSTEQRVRAMAEIGVLAQLNVPKLLLYIQDQLIQTEALKKALGIRCKHCRYRGSGAGNSPCDNCSQVPGKPNNFEFDISSVEVKQDEQGT